MSAINDAQHEDLFFKPDWEMLDKFMHEIEYDDNLVAYHKGERLDDIRDRDYQSLGIKC